MKQYSVVYEDADALASWLAEIGEEAKGAPTALFHIFCDCWADEEVAATTASIRAAFPDAIVVGSSSYGNVCEGSFEKDVVVIAVTFFERADTHVEAFAFPLAPGQAGEMGRFLVGEIEKRPWVKGVEVLVMKGDISLADFFAQVDGLPEDILVFGGESHFGHAPDAPRFVITNDGEILRRGAVFVLYGGDDLHFTTRYVQGWKPLSYEMEATAYTGNLLHELDGKCAYDLYHRYLHIENDDSFFFNALEFPFLFQVDDTVILRTPIACTEGGSLVLAASVPSSAKLRIAYGDPEEILKSVAACGERIAAFRPDAIMLFTCGVRRTFWNEEGSNRETQAFEGIAPTSGFFTAGEILRVNGRVLEHNSTLVIAAAREGDAEDKPEVRFEMPEERRRKSLVSRFAYFVEAALEELNDANEKLEALSRTDELTGLMNRREIERIIREECAGEGEAPAIIMIDLDDFKVINDTFGHHEGDEVLQRFARLAQEACESERSACAGRWGGEEFIVLMSETSAEHAAELSERIRAAFEGVDIGKGYRHTASFGAIKVHEGEGADAALSRADEAMYQAKALGKNQVVLQA